MPSNKVELAQLIAHRDGISFNEAIEIVDDCANELESAFSAGSIIEAENIIQDWLGLEPDYLDIFLY